MEISVCNSFNAFLLTKSSKLSPSFFHSEPSNLILFTKNTTFKRYSVPMRNEITSLFGFPKRSGGRGGGGILERPNLDISQFEPTPKVEEGGDMGKLKDRTAIGVGDGCKVLLIDDTRHTEKSVASILPKAVPAVTTDAAKELFHESRQNGAAVVIVAVKEHAEFYLEMMTSLGLSAAIEPDSRTV